ncbi:hypothetical protein GTW25_05150 [Aliihoeflea aestuarii]|jgi:uncharacterized membrane protein|uniref:hypothetical protein n=1 Tax=Aliihoeflea aestuarii TaxID=453840 RepID=UPI0020928496|nr:hypothetical protein [Aliihoeflea aestuarii]MCO6390412.1 hypothetical protein [Aliihoeflea aestuarii]
MKHIGVLGMIAAMLLTALPATAQDRGYYGLGGGHRPGSEFFAPGRGYDRDWTTGRRNHGGCSPGDALHKAERMGIRRAQIANVNRRTIDIVGRSRGERIHVTFARAPRCPLVG